MPLPAKIQELIDNGVIKEVPPKQMDEYQLSNLRSAAVQELIEKRVISIQLAANLHRMIVWALNHEQIKDYFIENKLSIKTVSNITSNVLMEGGGYIEGLADYDFFESSDTDSDTEDQDNSEIMKRTHNILLESFRRNPPLTQAEFRLSLYPDSIFFMSHTPDEPEDTELSKTSYRFN